MNIVVLSGRLTKETDLKYTSSGTAIANNTLAVEDGFGENKQNYFINLVFFQKTAESVANHSFKGQKSTITGKLIIRNYEKDGKKIYITEIHCNSIEYHEWKQRNEENQNNKIFTSSKTIELSDDDLPF